MQLLFRSEIIVKTCLIVPKSGKLGKLRYVHKMRNNQICIAAASRDIESSLTTKRGFQHNLGHNHIEV